MLQVAEDINKKVGMRADAVRLIKKAIDASLAEDATQSRHKCCEDYLNFTVDPRFPGKVTNKPFV